MLVRVLRIECECCRQWVKVDRFLSSAEGIEITCPACDASFFVPSAPATAAVDEADVPDIVWRPPDAASGASQMSCPKCGEEQRAARACRRCGLAADRFASYAAEAAADLPAEIALTWRRCLRAWRDPAAHEAFAEAVAAAGAFAHAARLYRGYLRDHPGDERASGQLERVGRMAEAAAFAATPAAHRSEREREPYRAVVWLLVFFGLLAVGGALYALLTREAGQLRPDLDATIEWRSPPAGRSR
jgi:ribosomal protein L32